MLTLIVFSGFLNLMSQVLFQKMVSMTVGDLYTTFVAVSLTFILGSGIGSYFGHLLRRGLPFVELGSGIYLLLMYVFLGGDFYAIEMSLGLVVFALVPPALCLGFHLPLYSYYFRSQKFGWIYALYHGGAILSLVALEWYFVHAGSVRSALLVTATAQILLGLMLVFLYKKNVFKIALSKLSSGVSFFDPRVRISATAIYSISALSYVQIFWALRTQVVLTESFRMQATLVMASIFAWMTLAGFFEKILRVKSRASIFWLWSASVLVLHFGLHISSFELTGLYSDTVLTYVGVSFVLALVLTMPVFFSSLLFVGETQRLSQEFEVDRISGFLNLVAGIGSLSGALVAAASAGYLWKPSYFSSIILLAAWMFVVLGYIEGGRKLSRKLVWVFVLVGGTLLLPLSDQQAELYQNRFIFRGENDQVVRLASLSVDAFSTVALVTMSSIESPNVIDNLFYFVDGHMSHNIKNRNEVVVGLLSGKYFDQPLSRALVVGVGTGQSAWAVQAVSQSTDLVEIAPAAFKGLSELKEYNNDLVHKPKVNMFLADGFSFVRKCRPGSYDLILSTATYPANFNASKLYSEEFVALSKRCLTEKGVFETYFDASAVQDKIQLADFLAPLKKHFKYIDIFMKPYPVVVAYDADRSLRLLSGSVFVSAENSKFYFAQIEAGMLDLRQCSPVYRKVQSSIPEGRMSTLDRSFTEAHSFSNIVSNIRWEKNEIEFGDYFKPEGQDLQATCE